MFEDLLGSAVSMLGVEKSRLPDSTAIDLGGKWVSLAEGAALAKHSSVLREYDGRLLSYAVAGARKRASPKAGVYGCEVSRQSFRAAFAPELYFTLPTVSTHWKVKTAAVGIRAMEPAAFMDLTERVNAACGILKDAICPPCEPCNAESRAERAT